MAFLIKNSSKSLGKCLLNTRNLSGMVAVILFSTCVHLSTVTVVTATISTLTPKQGLNLNSVLKRYENIHLNPIDILSIFKDLSLTVEGMSAARCKSPPIHFKIEAFERTFLLSLRRGESSFTPDAQVVVHDIDEQVTEFPASDFQTNYVEGYIINEPNSYVHGHLTEGVFDGIISTKDENYYIEPASKFFDHANVSNAIMYKESDVQVHPLLSNTVRPKFCLTTNHHLLPTQLPTTVSDSTLIEILPATVGSVCKVKAVADPWFFKDLSRSSVKQAVANMEIHLKEADKMFRVADINGDGRRDNVRIRLSKAEIYEKTTDRKFLMGNPYLNASEYLELFTHYSHQGFCAAIAFSFRQFDNSVLGYAFRGAPGYAGGICYPPIPSKGSKRWMNVAMTSFVAPWGTLVLAQSSIVVTHEIGHMFGSPHDEDADGGACFVQPEDYHYIMSANANPGTSKINRQFSKCSLGYMKRNMAEHIKCLQCSGRECSSSDQISLARTLLLLYLIIYIVSPNQ